MELKNKLTVIEICLNEEKESQHELIGMLNTLFSDTKSSKEIKEVLSDAYEIPMNTGYGKEIDQMCNLSGRIEEKSLKQGIAQGMEQGIAQGMEQGIAQGMEQGIAQGIEQGILGTLASLVNDGMLAMEEAAKRANMTPSEFKKKMELMSKKEKTLDERL